MLRRAKCLVLLFLIFAPFAEARWATPEDVEAVLEGAREEIFVRKDGTFTVLTEEKYEILKDSARRDKGVMRRTYNSRAGKMALVEAYTLNGKKKHPVSRKLVEHKPLASNGTGFDQFHQFMVAFPEVNIGSRIYAKWKREVHEIPVPGFFASEYSFGDWDYEKDSRGVITSELPLYVWKNDPEQYLEINRTVVKGKYRVEIIQKKPILKRAINEENSLMNPKKIPRVIVSTAQNWADIAKPLLEKYEAVLSGPLPPLHEKIATEAAKAATPEEKINRVTSLLATDMHYMGDWRPVKGGYIPRPLETIARTRYGDCKDFSASTAAILRRLGFTAHIAWVNRGDRPVLESFDLPTLSRFNHAIVRAELNGREYWIDPTNLASYAQGIFADIADRPALVLDPTKPRLAQTKRQKSEDGLVDGSLRIDFSKAEEDQVTASLGLKGSAAVSMTGASLNGSGDSIGYQLIRFLSGEDRLTTWKAEPFDLSSRVVADSTFRFHYGETPAPLKTSAGRGYVFPTPAHVQVLLTNVKNRVSDLYAGNPLTTQREYVLRNVVAVGEVSRCQVSSPWLEGHREVQNTSDGVRMTERLALKQGHIPVEELLSPEFAKLQTDLRQCFQSVAVIYKKL